MDREGECGPAELPPGVTWDISIRLLRSAPSNGGGVLKTERYYFILERKIGMS